MECRHIFPNGKRCRCLAIETHVFCLHHAPQPRPRTLRPRGVRLGSWRDIQIHLATLTRDEVPAAILTLLSALLVDGPGTPSDRKAGTLLPRSRSPRSVGPVHPPHRPRPRARLRFRPLPVH